MKKISKILDFGTNDIMDLSEAHKQRFFNLFLFLAIPSNLLLAIYNLLNGNYLHSSINLFQLLIFVIVFYFNRKRKYLYLRTCSLILLSLIIATSAIILKNGMEYRLLILMVVAVVLFENNLKFIAFTLSVSFAFTYCRILDYLHLGLEQNMIAFKVLQIFVPFIFTYGSLFYFKKLYVKSQYHLQIALDEVSKSNEMKERIMYSLAHDLRSPLSNVIAASQFLKDQGTYTDIQTKFLDIIESSSAHSHAMIKELMDSNQVLVKQQEKQLLNVNDVLNSVVDQSVFKAREKNISFVYDASICKNMVLVDPFKIERLFTNLINNAIKFSHKSSTIEVAVSKENSNVLVSIKDQGVGIPEKQLGIIFDPFTKAKRLGTENEPSYGLGLSICKQIVETHGGIINVISELGKGSEFIVSLPNPA